MNPLLAQDLGGQAIRLGDTELRPSIGLSYLSIDNAFRTADNPEEATGFVLTPTLEWTADRRLLELSATYLGSYGSFSESVLDYDDHELQVRADADLATRHRVSGQFSLLRSHEDVGTGQARFAVDEDDQVVSTETTLAAGYTYGAADAKGNVGTGITLYSESYNNVEGITEGDDNTTVRPYAFFSYRISPDTRLLTEVGYEVLDYDADNRDRSELTLLAGVDLAATAKTSGRIRVGVSNADYDAVSISDTTQLVANINLTFRPRSFTRFDLAFYRDLDTVDNDVDGAGDSIVDVATLIWRYDWSSRFTTVAQLRSEQTERTCPSVDLVTNLAALDLGLKVRRWLSVGVGVGQSWRDVDECDESIEPGSRDYDRTVVTFRVNATL